MIGHGPGLSTGRQHKMLHTPALQHIGGLSDHESSDLIWLLPMQMLR